MSRSKEIFYIYDTAQDAGDMKLQDPAQHRSMLGNLAKRTWFFMVAPAKMGVPEETFGQIEIGYRYFEGAAAGTIMLGKAPDCPAFGRLFDWPDPVIPIQPDGSDIVETIRRLRLNPERLQEMSRRNAVEALLRHDWVYRWEQVLNVAGMKPVPALANRKKLLQDLAAEGAAKKQACIA
jgi:hypothetical protein